MDKPFQNDYNQNDYNQNDYNQNDYNNTYDNEIISESFEYFLICVLLCGSWLSCFDLIKTCSTNCIKSCRIKNRVTIKKVDSDDEDNLLNECSICLENYKKGLQVDHVDRNLNNLDPENLKTYCPNAHSGKTMKYEDYMPK